MRCCLLLLLLFTLVSPCRAESVRVLLYDGPAPQSIGLPQGEFDRRAQGYAAPADGDARSGAE